MLPCCDEATFGPGRAPLSAPTDPLFPNGFLSGYDITYFSNGGDGVEFVTVKYSPAGDIWASFVKDMCGNDTTACTWDYAAHASSRFQGAAGLLAHSIEPVSCRTALPVGWRRPSR
jgi:hypothetical protein